MPLSTNALRAVKQEIRNLAVAYIVGHSRADSGAICKFDPFARFIAQCHPTLVDYLELRDFQMWVLETDPESCR